jgi:hypothetical protein
MRLYAVITPPPVVLEHVCEALGRAALRASGVARNDAALLSCRLAAFGNLALPDLTIVRDALAEIGGYCPPLALRLAGAEARPTVERANEVGVGIAGDVDELWSLARAVPPMVKRHGLLLDRRGFHPDIPVVLAARASFHAGALLAALHGYSGPEWVATEMRLVRLIPRGFDTPGLGDYEELARYPFLADHATAEAAPLAVGHRDGTAVL